MTIRHEQLDTLKSKLRPIIIEHMLTSTELVLGVDKMLQN